METRETRDSTAKAVQCTTLSLQRIHDIHGRDSLALGVLRVRDRISDNVLEEHLQDTTGFLIDETRDPLDTTTTCQTTNRRLGDALDIVAQHLSVTLGTSLPQTLASFAATRHDVLVLLSTQRMPVFAALSLYIPREGRNLCCEHPVLSLEAVLSTIPLLYGQRSYLCPHNKLVRNIMYQDLTLRDMKTTFSIVRIRP